jgi:helix-turn-helix protein
MEKINEIQSRLGNKVFRDQIVTIADLKDFKTDLLLSIKSMIHANHGQPVKRWLKSFEVKKLLGISPGTLQTLRSKGTLPFTRIGGIIYYDSEDVQKMLTERKQNFLRGPGRY